jgi:hypothetical protein
MPTRLLHIVNSARRDARIAMETTKPRARPALGVPGRTVEFRRYLAATERGLDESLTSVFGDQYGQALVDGDPEVDMEVIGRAIVRTETVYLSATGEVLHASPQVMEVLLDPDGSERERRVPEDVPANVNDELPVRWTGRQLSKDEVVHRFAFTRTMQLRHVDGLTYDFLFAMARELAEAESMMIVGGGPRGRDPLVFMENGSPYRGFLEGRVDGERYQLLLHLSNMELKLPASAEEESK